MLRSGREVILLAHQGALGSYWGISLGPRLCSTTSLPGLELG